MDIKYTFYNLLNAFQFKLITSVVSRYDINFHALKSEPQLLCNWSVGVFMSVSFAFAF